MSDRRFAWVLQLGLLVIQLLVFVGATIQFQRAREILAVAKQVHAEECGGRSVMEHGTKPRIGEPRIYEGEVLPVLYPGERATAILEADEFLLADPEELRYLQRGFPSRITVKQWLVEPVPTWWGAFRRWQYRLRDQLGLVPK
jgi:hypothetical protein